MERSGAGGEQDPGAHRGLPPATAGSHPAEPPCVAGKRRKSSKKGLEQKRWQSLEERGSARHGRLPALARASTYDPSSCREGEREAGTGGQGGPASSLGKRAASFRRLFGAVAAREVLLDCFSCAWQKEVPYHGRLYVSTGHVCFHCSLLLKDIKAVVPVPSISALKKTNTALLVPNALSIRTAEGEKFLFVSLRRREATFQLLRSLCRHLEENGPSGSPASALAGSTQQVLKKTQTSSQSDPEQSAPELGSIPAVPDGPSPRPGQAEQGDEVPALGTGGPRAAAQTKTTLRAWLSRMSFLNTIIVIYLLLMVALLLSSGYIGLRIAELEQQLTALGAWPDFRLQHQ